MQTLNIGGHVSLHGKPRATVQWAAEHGFGCLQIFASSPGTWRAPATDRMCAKDFALARREYSVNPLFIHSIYLINLASADPLLVGRSKSSLHATIGAAAVMGASGVVTHIGSHAGRGFAAVADQVAEVLAEILTSSPQGVQLLLENSAGTGGTIGAEVYELGGLIRRCGSSDRLQIALDTAHLFAAGWDLTKEGAAERLVVTLDREIGLDRLALIHANDSARPCGSRRDRHANIGDGHIGLEGFRQLLAQSAFRQVPWILETPDLERRVDDLTILHALAVGSLPTGLARILREPAGRPLEADSEPCLDGQRATPKPAAGSPKPAAGSPKPAAGSPKPAAGYPGDGAHGLRRIRTGSD
jgi:deoxyribonuclease IV